jgi:hypothetical protein
MHWDWEGRRGETARHSRRSPDTLWCDRYEFTEGTACSYGLRMPPAQPEGAFRGRGPGFARVSVGYRGGPTVWVISPSFAARISECADRDARPYQTIGSFRSGSEDSRPIAGSSPDRDHHPPAEHRTAAPRPAPPAWPCAVSPGNPPGGARPSSAHGLGASANAGGSPWPRDRIRMSRPNRH